MSRIGKKPVPVPSGVKVSIDGRTVTTEGPKGTLSMTHRPEIRVVWNEDEKSIVCAIDDSDAGDRRVRALWGTTRSIIENMVEGVSRGYERKLVIEGVGWAATVKGQELELTLGYASPVSVRIPEGVSVVANKQEITVSGSDKQAVGQFAAVVRSKREPEPYNGKGVRYADETIRRKQGKQFGS